MTRRIKIFISYSHADAQYLPELLKSLETLEQDRIEIWWDEKITPGELWNEKIRLKVEAADIGLILVSQAFLDSDYCGYELETMLARDTAIVPVLLSDCVWQNSPLASRQMIPGGGRTVVECCADPDATESLFREIVVALDGHIRRIADLAANPFTETRAIRDVRRFIGRETELRRLRNLLQDGSVILGGEPKVGKSSLLWRLADTWQGTLLGHLDLQMIEDRDDFYRSLGEMLGLDSGDWRCIREELKKRSGLLLLDELDYGPEVGLSAADLSRFRAVCESNRAFRILAVSREPLRAIFPQKRGSKGYSFLQPLTLRELTEPEARQLLSHHWMPEAPAFDTASIPKLLEKGGGHPFKLQRAAYHCYEVLTELAPEWEQAWRQDMDHLL